MSRAYAAAYIRHSHVQSEAYSESLPIDGITEK